VSIVNRTGGIIREILDAGDLGIVDKSKTAGFKDLQTAADRNTQRCIVASLHKQYPKIKVFGEEDLDTTEGVQADWVVTDLCPEVLKQEAKFPADLKDAKDEDICIWVDPLDGTAEFTEGLLDHVTVLIGIAVKGVAKAGVIYQPYYNYQAGPGATLGRVVWGIVGLGAFGFAQHKPPSDKRIITTTRSHMTPAVKEAIEACSPTEILRVGGAGHKVLLLIEGRAHAYLFASPGCKKWDTCAPEAVLHAIGGLLTDVHGNLYTYEHDVKRVNSGGTLATALAEEHPWYLSKMADEIRKALPA
jgi:3'(2'), 5'-bisphosphate nucleotidase